MRFQTVLLLLLTTLAPSMLSAQYVDAVGDSQDLMGLGGALHDIDTVNVHFDSSNLFFEVLFLTPISAPSTGNADAVIGVIELDTDQLVTTGIPAIQNMFSPEFGNINGVGTDFLLLLDDSMSPGQGSLLDSGEFLDPISSLISFVPLVYGPNSISGQLPLSDLGNDDGLVNFTTIVGTNFQPTDASEGVTTSTAVPEPSNGLLLLSAIAPAFLTRRKRF